MIDAQNMTDNELCLIAETWIGQLDYSKGVHYLLEQDAQNNPIPSCSSVITELVNRVRMYQYQNEKNLPF